MFSKFKKVLVSLALASSLALAPMNVSAGTLTQDSSDAETDTNYRFIDHAYSVTVPDSIDFTSDAKSQILTITATDNLVDHKITVTPSFTAIDGVTASIGFVNTYVEFTTASQATITATLDDSGITNKDNYVNSTKIGKITYDVETEELNS